MPFPNKILTKKLVALVEATKQGFKNLFFFLRKVTLLQTLTYTRYFNNNKTSL